MAEPSFSKKEALKFGWETFKSNYTLLVGVFLLVFLINYLPTVFFLMLEEALELGNITGALVLIAVVSIIVGILMAIGILNITLKLVDGKPATFKDLLEKSSLWLKYLGTGIMYVIIVVLGFIALIIPGIYFSIKYYFGYYFVVDQGMSPTKALKKSAELTKGNIISLIAFFALLALINIVAAIPTMFTTEDTAIWLEMVLSVGLLVSMPVTYLASTHVYRQLEKKAQIVQY